MQSSTLISKFLTLIAALAVVAPAQGAARDDLLRLVPDEVGFCLLIQDLRGQAEAFLGSRFVKQLEDSPVGLALAQTPEVRKIGEVDQHLQKALGVSWAQLRDDLLGEAVVLAYQPGPPGRPEQEQGLCLLKARNPGLLAEVLQRLTSSQKQSGDLKDIEVHTYHDVEYTCRIESKGKNFFYQSGPILVFTSSETMIRKVIDRQRQADKSGPLMSQHLSRLGVEKGLMLLWLNPRAFDAELDQKASQAVGANILVLKTVLAYWKALEGIVLSATLQKDDLEVGLGMLVQESRLPPAARKAFKAEVKASDLWLRFPERAILTMADRVDPVALSDFLGEFLPAEGRAAVNSTIKRGAGAFGTDFVKDVLPSLGPDWGLCITGPNPADQGWVPQVIFALRVQPGAQKPSADEALLKAMDMLALFAVLAYKSDHADELSLKTDERNQGMVKYLANDKLFPPGLQPAYGFKKGYLVLASSPEAIHRFAADAPSPPVLPGGEAPFLRFSLQELAKALEWKALQDVLIAHIADKHHISKEEAGAKLANLIAICRLFDRVEWSQRATPGGLTLLVRVRTAQPLKK